MKKKTDISITKEMLENAAEKQLNYLNDLKNCGIPELEKLFELDIAKQGVKQVKKISKKGN